MRTGTQLELQDQAAHVAMERVYLPSRQSAQLSRHVGGVAPENGQATIMLQG